MPHGMQINTMATEITHEQVDGLLPGAKKAFLDGLEEFKRHDLMSWSEDFGAGWTPFRVWQDSKFYISEKGHVRALQPNNVVMVWDTHSQEWGDNDHDD